ncbi:hypothetical protein Runsl_0714 [Runella slithyformis DSM 19594]|uniref:Uncharacterized protein n=1 Tax=Runella slithyformis (strain ATCC 29530 / DSM 19594 / LMG 11500 / NCIMB 11436 / LSU 4) TaxID=761193 RepID=A0A7U4E458_RUNSL|nr:hypothetical protein Runsl_0714 [Runella slithyformis DSM 19594]
MNNSKNSSFMIRLLLKKSCQTKKAPSGAKIYRLFVNGYLKLFSGGEEACVKC